MSNAPIRKRLRTVQFVTLTAFDTAERLNLDPMRKLTRRLADAGAKVFIPCAGSSEFHSLTSDEIHSALAMTAETAGDKAIVMAPVGRQLSEAIVNCTRARDAGADAVLVMPLDFPYLSDNGCRDYYMRVLDESPLPVLIYKKAAIPSDDLLLQLAEHDNLVGVKYAVNDIDAFTKIVHDDGGRIDWYCGSAERFAPFFMLAGASGYTSGAGNICPRVTLAMYLAASEGIWPEVMRLQRMIRPIEDYRARRDSSYNISFLKYAISHLGLEFGPPRPPQRKLTDAEKEEIDRMMPAIIDDERSVADSMTLTAG